MKWLVLVLLTLSRTAGAQVTTTSPVLSRDRVQARLVVGATAPGCARAEEIAARVNALVHRDALTLEGHAEIRVELTLEAGEAGHLARLRLLRGEGQVIGMRELASPGSRCAELTRPLALVLALMIDLPHTDTRLRLPVPEPLAVATASPGAERVAPDAGAVEEPGPAADSGWGLELGLAGFVAGGMLGPWTLGPRAVLRVAPSPLFSLEAAFAWLPTRDLKRDDLRVAVGAYLLEFGPCFSFGNDSVGVSLCGTLSVGNASAVGQNFGDNRRVDYPLAAARVRADLRLPLGDVVALRVGAGLGVGIVSQRLVYETPAGSRSTFFAPWPVRPFGLVEIAWTPKWDQR